jgi:peptidoglycan hydrolase-like protein with peptidoglycan-binding domain
VNIRIILPLSTIGIALGGLLGWQTEAGASQNFSRHYTVQGTFTAEENSYQSLRKKRKLVKSSNPIKTSQSRPRSMFDLLNENETLPKTRLKKRRNSDSSKNQLPRGAARRAEIRKLLTGEAARRLGTKRKEPVQVFDLLKDRETDSELKSKSRLDDNVVVTVVDAGEFKKRFAEKAARQTDIRKRLTAEVALALAKQLQAEVIERQGLAVAESRIEANLTDAGPIPPGEWINIGERDARVPTIRARMEKLGFLSEENSFAWMLGHAAEKVSDPSDLELILDKELSKAIKAFQKANRIKQTGRIDEATVTALNAPEEAAKQRQAEEQRKAQEAVLALAKQRQAEEERKDQEAALALEKQRQTEEAQHLAAEAAAKQRQAEKAQRFADNPRLASIDSVSEANEASSKSCNKAKAIIGKYGFENIETKSCNGKIYNFAATRKGKRYLVKINARTSELTEIKKLLSSTE